MSRIIINPTELHDPVHFGYSHATTTTGEIVAIAGQYGSDQSGGVVPGGFSAQVAHALANLGVVLAAAGLGYNDVIRIGTYVVDHDADKLSVIVDQITRIWDDRPPAQTLIGVASLALPGMLFEIDAIASRSH